MKLRLVFSLVLCAASIFSFAQKGLDIIDKKEVLRIENFLASDDLKGRKPGTPGIEKAADFISEEFKKSGLSFLPNMSSYKQTFSYIKTKVISAEGTADGEKVEAGDMIAISTDSVISISDAGNFKKAIIKKDDNLFLTAGDILKKEENTIVFVDKAFSIDFNRLRSFRRDGPKKKFTVVFVKANNPTKYTIEIKNNLQETVYSNVVGVLPGKSKKAEMVIFSGHYDHLGVTKKPVDGDSIYNGANDDAAGTTAVIMLANYFAKQKNNERTLVFVAFTAEEIGGFGSSYFSTTNMNADKIVAMFNIEMIGTESKWGKNSAYITGYEKSDFGKILQKNLSGSSFKFEPDPYPKENLFYRSDNATLAALGVPAHTISTSKMDSEKNYHKLTDEVATLDIDNMTEIIKSIAISSKTIVSGKDTPSRVVKQ
jgi:Zn-dependent M28 family amino/carboxypeptidase